ncbi:unnamed protein product, partial [marine sediment metagenome]
MLEGAIRDNDGYLIEDEVYEYRYQEALDGKTVHRLKVISPFGDPDYIDREEFAIYYLNDKLEVVPIYSTINGSFYKEGEILDYLKNPTISYVDNAFLLNIYWKKNADNFIDYDTYLLVTYKAVKGKTISPLSYSSLDSYGNSLQENLVEIPFAKYDMISKNWTVEDNFIEGFLIDKRALYEDVESTSALIEGPEYDEGQIIQTGIIGLVSVYVNKSYSEEFVFVNESNYNWSINVNGELSVSDLNYSEGDVFQVCYLSYYPAPITHP